METDKLKKLVDTGVIKAFEVKNVPEAGQEVTNGYSEHCNSDCLLITFNNDEVLTLTSVTTGSRSDAILKVE